MNILPSEVRKEIFLYLNKEDLQTCHFVCKLWYSIVIPISWQEVTLQDDNIPLVKSHLSESNHGQYFEHGRLIKKLTIRNPDRSVYILFAADAQKDYERQYKFSKLELLKLLSQLSNLKEIDLSDTSYFEEYLEFLLDANLEDINKIDAGHFDYDLQESYTYEVYFLVCYKFRKSISWMPLSYRQETYNFNSQQINVFDSLTQFKELTELEFHNKYDIHLTPIHVQDHCPKLKYLKFASDYPISESVMLPLLDRSSKINLNFISSLRNLTLELPSLSDIYTRYLVDYIPNQLTDLSIEISGQSLFNWVDTVEIELALGLMEKIGVIEETRIAFRLNNTHGETNTTKYFKLLNAFRGTRHTYCKASVTVSVEIDEDTDYIFEYDSNGKLFIAYGLYYDTLGSFEVDTDLHDTTNSVIGLEKFDSLEFTLLGEHSDMIYNALEYSLSFCPRLRSLDIKYGARYPEMCYSLSYKHKEYSTFSYQPNHNTHCLRMKNIIHVERYFNLVTAHLYDIDTVWLQAKFMDRFYDGLVIDLTCFKKLKKFIYSSINLRQEDDFVLIKYTNGEEQCRYLHEEKDKDAQVEFVKNPSSQCFTIICDASLSFDFNRYEIAYWSISSIY
ncbi:hypothetical protein MFLAVUS_008924 [Mucor flavus]|uniref:F-box domain-containing protein n=1 Tax=Mucor flavus TaxID=439312 RepID=A0ABP9Z8L1_9FUNG